MSVPALVAGAAALSSAEEKTWVELAPPPGVLPAIPAEAAPPPTEDHTAMDRGQRLGKSLAPRIAIAADTLAPAPDRGEGAGRRLDPAFRRDTSTLHARLTDGSSRYRPEHERTDRAVSSQRRGVITLVTAPGDGEVTVVTDESMGEKDPLLAKLLAAATAGAEPAGPASKRQPIRIVLGPDERPVGKGVLCGQSHGFNLQAATRVAANDKQGRERLCRRRARAKRAWGGGRAGRP